MSPFVCPSVLTANRTKESITGSQRDLVVETNELPEERKHASDHVAIGFSLILISDENGASSLPII